MERFSSAVAELARRSASGCGCDTWVRFRLTASPSGFDFGESRVGLISGLLTLPLAPVRGTVWLAERIQEQAEAELYDETAIRTGLLEIESAGETGEPSEGETSRRGGRADRAADVDSCAGGGETMAGRVTTAGSPRSSWGKAALSDRRRPDRLQARGRHRARMGRRVLAGDGGRAGARAHSKHHRRDRLVRGPARRGRDAARLQADGAFPARSGGGD